jgi:hypothetical protein
MRILLLAVALVVAGAASAQDFPKLKSGLWEVTSTAKRSDSPPPRVASMCLDDSVQQDMYRMSSGMMAGMCSKHDVDISGATVTTSATCDLGGTRMQSQSVMTLTGNTAYRTEAHATFDPPMAGTKESTTVIEGKYVGPCKAGQQPGDMTLPGGQTINIRQMIGRKS